MDHVPPRALLALAVLATTPACRIDVSGSRSVSGIRLSEEARREVVHAFELAPGERLTLATDFGDVEVAAREGARPELRATLRAHGRTRAEAEAVLARYRVVLGRGPDGPRIVLEGEPLHVHQGSARAELAAQADFVATVPVGTDLTATSGSGDLVTRGALGALALETGFGSVAIDTARGDARARSGSGDVRAARLEGQEAVLTSGFGDVRVEAAHARRVTCTSGSGDVHVGHASADELRLSTYFGGVHVQQASGAVHASSGSGDVRLHGVSGAVVARSDFGTVEVEGVLSALDAWSGSGDVRARARAGSRVAAGWELGSSHGTVLLEVPEGFACELDARTGHGSVQCDFPVTVEAGERRGDGALKGTLGAGGGPVRLTSGSGDVRLKRL